MNIDEFKSAAENLNAELMPLSARKLYVCAHAYKAESNYPDRIIVEGIKNLRSTGRFTDNDRGLINSKLFAFCHKHDLTLKVFDHDYGTHMAVITNN